MLIIAFADDTQLYVQCRHNDTTFAVQRLEHCITDVVHWMSANRLKLSTDKTRRSCCRPGHVTVQLCCAALDRHCGSDLIPYTLQRATTSCSYHDTDVRCLAVGPSLLLVRRPGTRCQTVYETRHVLPTAFGRISKLENFSVLILLAYTTH